MSSENASERFLERRRTKRRRTVIALLVIILLAFGGVLYQVWQSPVRISQVEIFGADQSFAKYAHAAMEGSYLGIVPRNSTFLYPARAIRAAIMREHPNVAAVSIFRKGLTGLSIKVSERVGIARWCGKAPTPGVEEYCYVFDANGLVFAPADQSAAPINSFTLYGPLRDDAQEPLRAELASAENLPSTFDFARQLDTFGSAVTRVVIRGDEVDQHLESGTRVTYVLGNEQNAFTALVSARENLNLADGSVEYVDLRFGQKMYVKKR